MKIKTGEFSGVLSNSFWQEMIFHIQGRTWVPHKPFLCHVSWHVWWGTVCMVFRKGKMNICGFFGSFLLLVVLSHVVSVLVFPNEVFLTHLARKVTFVMCSWLMNHKIDFLCKRFCTFVAKEVHSVLNAWIGLIQFNWFPNFYSQISHYQFTIQLISQLLFSA